MMAIWLASRSRGDIAWNRIRVRVRVRVGVRVGVRVRVWVYP